MPNSCRQCKLRKCDGDYSNITVIALKQRQFDIMQWIYSEESWSVAVATEDLIVDLDTIKYIHELGILPNDWTFWGSIMQRCPQMAPCDLIKKPPVIDAAKYGALDTLKYLVEIGQKCDTCRQKIAKYLTMAYLDSLDSAASVSE